MHTKLLCLGVALMASTAAASAQNAPAPVVNVEVEPIACYWRTGSPAVRIGQPFTLVLTCSVLDTTATTVVPDQSQLDPGVLQVQPFEVLRGRQAQELRTANRRFFQYDYTLRYIGEEIGKDLAIPPLTISYRVQSRVRPDSAAVESREREYILPARPIRILSLVPPVVSDIRDEPPPTLAAIEARRFRASVLRIVSWMLFALGGVIAVWALVGIARTRRGAVTAVVRHASDAAILRGVSRELADVGRESAATGWTDVLAARAGAALRIAASLDTSHPVSQTPASLGEPAAGGQLRVPARWPRGGDVLLSGSMTTLTLAGARELLRPAESRRAARLAAMEGALASLTAAAYGRGTAGLNADRLDDALAAGTRELSALRREHTWIATKLRGLARTVSGFRTRAWAR
ncbi:MAG: hypothetical protein ABL993_12180 [Vicinamibacterales bacterium]